MNGRSILAVLLGVVAGAILINLAQFPLRSMYPIDKEVYKKFSDPAFYRQFMLSRPVGVYVIIIVSNALGILGGMFTSRLLDRKNAMSMFAAAGLLLLANIVTLLAVPHPTWFPFADLAMSIGAALGYGGYIWRRSKKA